MSTLPTIVSFWHGPLGWLERLSIASFVAAGHAYRVYSYAPVGNLPEGAERCDAADVLPQDRMFFYKGAHTPAVFADLFRLELLARGEGLWADMDMVALKPFADLSDYVFGYEVPPGKTGGRGSINNAVLGCPAGSELLKRLLSVFDEDNRDMALPWLPPLRRLEVAMKRMTGRHPAPYEIQFGATGPFPLTWHVRDLGLEDRVLPDKVFYPVPYKQIPSLFAAGSRIGTWTTERTLGVHVWRSQLTDRGRGQLPAPPPDSALADLCQRFGVSI